jgi:H+/Cl- antiporter ClcA
MIPTQQPRNVERSLGCTWGRILGQWTALGAFVGVACGLASAAFLALLELATDFRGTHVWIVYLLPLAGLGIGAIYERWGSAIRGGNNLIIDTLHDDAPQIPLRMAPMVLIGTVLTHLFGGSAGREGTAVQMGASVADAIAHRFRVGRDLRRIVIAAGIAGGFAAVFGTPIAGLIFGLEVVCIGRIEYDALIPALVAAVVGDQVTRALGIVHTAYPVVGAIPFSVGLGGKLVLVAAAMALATIAFIELTHFIKARMERHVPRLPFRMFVGGVAIVALWRLVGNSDYLGLGVPMILRAFRDPHLPAYSFAAKIVFTAVTLGCGFLGGEVTPLFFIGATLGNIVARLVGIPIELGAAVGLAAVFGAAANTPLALSIMMVELVGGAVLPYVVIVTVIAYLLTGHRGIYPAQRLLRKKHGPALDKPVSLRDYRDQSAPKIAPPE